ncbi:MAG: ABC-F family ATP-binding cassette domain-containing protein, partial [Phycisphaeraceae bacterium]
RDRLGLIGPNGAGKSTLLRMLAGFEPPDGGEVVRRAGGGIAYVGQADEFPEGATPRTAVLAAVAAAGDRAATLDPETQAAIVLTRLGFDDPDRPVAGLSGGWRKRLSLACGLAGDPDVLLLDEPTNHLDLEGVRWLEELVRRERTRTFVVITHDRHFLEAVATRVAELSRAYPGGVLMSDGDYSAFVERKQAFLEAQAAAESALANRVRQDTAWLRQGIKARETRNRSQVKAADARRGELAAIRDRNAAPTGRTSIDFQATDRRSRRLVELVGVAKSMGGRRLFADLDLVVGPGDRLGLLGANGTGKTTLMRILSGDLEPDAGSVRRPDGLRIASFRQDRASLDPRLTLRETLCPIGDFVDHGGRQVHVAGWAKRFLFDEEQLSTFVGHLSGGEQARIVMANLMLAPADVLLLDEPTNDLDIPSLEVLEQSLLEFPGGIVLVTHHRFMLERVATGFVGLDGRGGARAFASLEQWLATQAQIEADAATASAARTAAAATAPPTPPSAPARGRTRKLSYNEQREFDAMEETILAAEAEVERLEAETADPALATDHERAAKAFAALSAAQAKVQTLYERWAELEAIATGS